MKYYINKTLNSSFEEAEQKTIEALKQEGFGIITTIDMQEKLKEKIGVDYRKYKILGACNPPSAYQALRIDDKIGLMLPCNVIVQEIAKNEIEVAAIDPVESMGGINNHQLKALASDIKDKLVIVINSI